MVPLLSMKVMREVRAPRQEAQLGEFGSSMIEIRGRVAVLSGHFEDESNAAIPPVGDKEKMAQRLALRLSTAGLEVIRSPFP
jgi:hypothetical protein